MKRIMQKSLVCAALLSALGSLSQAQAADAKNVILFIGDGMGPAHVEGAGYYVNGAAGSLRMEAMPYRGSLRTASLTGITDSAAGASAMSAGAKTWNAFFELLHEVAVPVDFMDDRPLNVLPKERGVFDDERAHGHNLPAQGEVGG